MEEKKIEVGDVAPNFTLPDQDSEEHELSEYRGERVLLSFHSLAWTSVCQQQMEALEEYIDDLDDLETVALGISVDPVPTKRAWAESMDIEETALLSDFWPHGEVAQAYGIFRDEEGVSQRAVFIVDEDGVILWKKIYPMDEAPDIEEILDVLEST